MDTRRAWVLNLDAEYELEALLAGRSYAPTRAVARQVERARPLAMGLLVAGDLILDGTHRDAGGIAGHAWCPTPLAQERLRQANAAPFPSADPRVIGAVNHRRFCAELGQSLPGAVFLDREEDVVERVCERAPFGTWLLKRPLAMAGRGRRAVAAGAPTSADRDWIRASLLRGGLQVEPRVRIEREFELCGWIAEDGELRTLAPLAQDCDEHGSWIGARVASNGELGDAEREALAAEAELVGAALHRAGYFGPFGIDAYRWLDDRGRAHFVARGEVNARYTMGWSFARGDLGG